MPETKIGNVEVLDARDESWIPTMPGNDPLSNELATETVHLERAQTCGAGDRVAIFVSLTPDPDRTAFEQLLHDSAEGFTAAAVVSVTGAERIDPREAARLSAAVAHQIKRLSASGGRSEAHLAFHGPYTMAALVGRDLNTLRTVVYEWDGDTAGGPSYKPVLVLEPGVTGGPRPPPWRCPTCVCPPRNKPNAAAGTRDSPFPPSGRRTSVRPAT